MDFHDGHASRDGSQPLGALSLSSPGSLMPVVGGATCGLGAGYLSIPHSREGFRKLLLFLYITNASFPGVVCL